MSSAISDNNTMELDSNVSSSATNKSAVNKPKTSRRRKKSTLFTPKKRKDSSNTTTKRKSTVESGNTDIPPSAKKSKKSLAAQEKASTKELPSVPTSPNKQSQEQQETTKMQLEDTKTETKPKRKLKYSDETAVGSKSSSGFELLEKGHIAFLYRPKVELIEVHDFKDVQRLYMELLPDESVAGKDRLLIIANKKLPKPVHGAASFRRPDYLIVDKVSDNVKDIAKVLEPSEYDTKTRGHRHVEGVRVSAEGLYEIVRGPDEKTYMAYVIELPLPENFGPAQQEFNILPEEEFLLQVRNPKELGNKRTDTVGLAERGRGADIPLEVIERHCTGKTKMLRWCAAHPELMNYEKEELLLVGAHENLTEHIDKILAQELEHEAKQEEEQLLKTQHPEQAVYKELGMEENEHHPAEGLTEGKLV